MRTDRRRWDGWGTVVPWKVVGGPRGSPIASHRGSDGYASAWCIYPRKFVLLNIIRRRCSMTKRVGWEGVAAGIVTSVFLLEKHGLKQGKRLDV